MAKTTFEKLQEKIKKELDLDCCNFERTHAGKFMKRSGAFTWRCHLKESHNFEIGGCEPASNYLRKGVKLELYDHYTRFDKEIVICDTKKE